MYRIVAEDKGKSVVSKPMSKERADEISAQLKKKGVKHQIITEAQYQEYLKKGKSQQRQPRGMSRPPTFFSLARRF